jgi:hypothetical protein
LEEGDELPIKTKADLKAEKADAKKADKKEVEKVAEKTKAVSEEGAVKEDELSSEIQKLRNRRNGVK